MAKVMIVDDNEILCEALSEVVKDSEPFSIGMKSSGTARRYS